MHVIPQLSCLFNNLALTASLTPFLPERAFDNVTILVPNSFAISLTSLFLPKTYLPLLFTVFPSFITPSTIRIPKFLPFPLILFKSVLTLIRASTFSSIHTLSLSSPSDIHPKNGQMLRLIHPPNSHAFFPHFSISKAVLPFTITNKMRLAALKADQINYRTIFIHAAVTDQLV